MHRGPSPVQQNCHVTATHHKTCHACWCLPRHSIPQVQQGGWVYGDGRKTLDSNGPGLFSDRAAIHATPTSESTPMSSLRINTPRKQTYSETERIVKATLTGNDSDQNPSSSRNGPTLQSQHLSSSSKPQALVLAHSACHVFCHCRQVNRAGPSRSHADTSSSHGRTRYTARRSRLRGLEATPGRRHGSLTDTRV